MIESEGKTCFRPGSPQQKKTSPSQQFNKTSSEKWTKKWPRFGNNGSGGKQLALVQLWCSLRPEPRHSHSWGSVPRAKGQGQSVTGGPGQKKKQINKAHPSKIHRKKKSKKWPYFGQQGRLELSGTVGPSPIHPKCRNNVFLNLVIFDPIRTRRNPWPPEGRSLTT